MLLAALRRHTYLRTLKVLMRNRAQYIQVWAGLEGGHGNTAV